MAIAWVSPSQNQESYKAVPLRTFQGTIHSTRGCSFGPTPIRSHTSVEYKFGSGGAICPRQYISAVLGPPYTSFTSEK